MPTVALVLVSANLLQLATIWVNDYIAIMDRELKNFRSILRWSCFRLLQPCQPVLVIRYLFHKYIPRVRNLEDARRASPLAL